MLVQVRREFQSVLTPSCLDDITILGPISDVTDTYWKLKGHMSNIGLELREEKCEIHSPLGISRCQLPIREMKNEFELLGTLVRSDAFVKDACHGKVEKFSPLLSKLSLLQDAQMGVLLLRYCGVPKIMNLLCTVPPCLVDVACVQHDENIVTTFEEIIGVKCTDTQKHQVRLSIKNGDFGLTSARDTAPSAFLGAWANSFSHLPVHDDYVRPMCSYVIDDLQSSNYSISTHLNSSLHDLRNDSQSLKEIIPSISSLPDHPKKLQCRLQLVKNKSSFQQYLEVCFTDKEKAR